MSSQNRPPLVAAGQGTPPAERSRSPILEFLDSPAAKKSFDAVLGRHIGGDRFVRIVSNAIRATPRLLECSPVSLKAAMMSLAALSLEPNTPLNHAYLIPFGKNRPRVDANGEKIRGPDGKWIWDKTYECKFIIGYQGFEDLFWRSGLVTSVQAEAVYGADHFIHEFGTNLRLEYRKNLTAQDPGDIYSAFCFTGLKDGQAFTVLRLADILRARARSETWTGLSEAVEKAGNAKDRGKAEKALAETPWERDFAAMAVKTAVRQHAKKVKLSPQLVAAAVLDTGAEDGRIDLSQMSDPDYARSFVAGEQAPVTLDGDDDDVAAAPVPEPAPQSLAAPSEQPMAMPDPGARETAEVPAAPAQETAPPAGTPQPGGPDGAPPRAAPARKQPGSGQRPPLFDE